MTLQRAAGHVAVGLALLLSAASAQAFTVTVGNAAATLGPNATAGTFSGGAGGTLFVPSAPGTAGIPVTISLGKSTIEDATFTFTPVSATSGAVSVPGGKFDETTTGGTFDFSNGGTTYLTGDYSGGVLLAANHDSVVGLSSTGANSVTYTGGTFLGLASLSPGVIGSFNLGFSGADTGKGNGVGVSGGYIDSWVANGFSGTFSAQSSGGTHIGGAPEPGGWMSITVAVVFLAMLILRRPRREPLPLAG